MAGAELITDVNGLVWVNGGAETDDHLAFGGHEPALIGIVRSLLPAGGTFLDVGAHVGLYTLRMAQKAGRVFAIEANPLTYETLMENIKNNANAHEAVVHALNVAAWDCFEELSLVDENGKKTGGSTRCVIDAKDEAKTQGMPLDAVLPEDFKIDLVKIDVEGAEDRVLYGMAERLRDDRPVLFIEMHDRYYGLPGLKKRVTDFLETWRYTWDDSLEFSEQYYIVAKPAERSEDFEIEVVRAGENPDDNPVKSMRGIIEEDLGR